MDKSKFIFAHFFDGSSMLKLRKEGIINYKKNDFVASKKYQPVGNNPAGILCELDDFPLAYYDKANLNNYYFTKKLWNGLSNDPEFSFRMREARSFWGEPFHADSMEISLPNVSHKVLDFWAGDNNLLLGKVAITDTPMGNIIYNLMLDGEVGISSRGYGSKIPMKDNPQILLISEDDYMHSSFDFVSVPAVPEAVKALFNSFKANRELAQNIVSQRASLRLSKEFEALFDSLESEVPKKRHFVMSQEEAQGEVTVQDDSMFEGALVMTPKNIAGEVINREDGKVYVYWVSGSAIFEESEVRPVFIDTIDKAVELVSAYYVNILNGNVESTREIRAIVHNALDNNIDEKSIKIMYSDNPAILNLIDYVFDIILPNYGGITSKSRVKSSVMKSRKVIDISKMVDSITLFSGFTLSPEKGELVWGKTQSGNLIPGFYFEKDGNSFIRAEKDNSISQIVAWRYFGNQVNVFSSWDEEAAILTLEGDSGEVQVLSKDLIIQWMIKYAYYESFLDEFEKFCNISNVKLEKKDIKVLEELWKEANYNYMLEPEWERVESEVSVAFVLEDLEKLYSDLTDTSEVPDMQSVLDGYFRGFTVAEIAQNINSPLNITRRLYDRVSTWNNIGIVEDGEAITDSLLLASDGRREEISVFTDILNREIPRLDLKAGYLKTENKIINLFAESEGSILEAKRIIANNETNKTVIVSRRLDLYNTMKKRYNSELIIMNRFRKCLSGADFYKIKTESNVLCIFDSGHRKDVRVSKIEGGKIISTTIRISTM